MTLDQPQFPLTPAATPPLQALVDALNSACAHGGEPQPAHITAALSAAIAAGEWLPREQRRANHERYARHLIYADPQQQFSILALVWAPGQASPIHAHLTWCSVAVYQGTLTETFYAMAPGRKTPVEARREIRSAGSTSFDGADHAIHALANLSRADAISLHVYGVGGGRVAALRSEADIERIAAQVPLRRLAVPEDHAQAMLFLASDGAAYINGVVLDVNGGRVMM